MDNFIFVNKCLSKELCKFYIDFFDKHEKQAIRGYLGSENIMDDLEIGISVYKELKIWEGIVNTINKFIKKYPLLNTELSEWKVDEGATVMRYEPNDYCNLIHCENDGKFKRIFAWMIYLNTIKKGGGTEFLHQKTTAKPIAGDMYIWPAGWTHLHRGVVAPEERKYIITGWVSYK